jgi:signal transduction histidine kinase
MSMFYITGALLIVLILFLVIIVYLLIRYNRLKKQIKQTLEEKFKESNNLEKEVSDRTHTLEMIRDSVSEYAILKSELAQELEEKNLKIRRQRDDLYKQSEKLKNANDEIKKLEAYRQQMTRMIIHDLKNPLNLIINIAETNEISSKSGKMIGKLSWGMLDLIMNILEVNKLENMRMKINFISFDLTTSVAKLLDKFSFMLSNSSLMLKSEIPANIFIYADPQITERIFDNLISNAIKYSSSGDTILLSAVEEGENVRIGIKDNGGGIPANIMDEVFNEYVQGESRSFAYSNSTGIGLAYCKLAVEAMEGTIGISSPEGAGTLVWFTLRKGCVEKADNKKGNQITIPESVSMSFFSKLSCDSTENLKPVISKLRRTEIDEVSVILKILDDNIPENDDSLKKWKDQVLKAAFEGDSAVFNRLLNIV